MKRAKNQRTKSTPSRQALGRLKISWIGITFSVIYLAWAFYFLQIAISDQLKCVPQSFVSICRTDLAFVLATFPGQLFAIPGIWLANLIGIKGIETDVHSLSHDLSQWYLYIFFGLILVYFLGCFIQKMIGFLVGLVGKNRI